MRSEICRKIACPYFRKFSGKAACYFGHPKVLIKHLQSCPATLKGTENNDD